VSDELAEQLEEVRAALVASRAEVRKLRSAIVPLRSIARMTLTEGPSAPLANSIRSVLKRNMEGVMSMRGEVILETVRGEFVHRGSTLPYKNWPEVLVWGERVFMRFGFSHDEPAVPVYREVSMGMVIS